MDQDYEESESDGDENEPTDPLEVEGRSMELRSDINRLLPFVDESNISHFRKLIFPECYIRGLPWRFIISRFVGSSQRPHLGIHIQCNPESDSKWWTCKAQCEIEVLPQSPGVIAKTRISVFKFNAESSLHGYNKFLEWDILSDPANGYLKDDCIKIQVTITADMPKGGIWDCYKTIFPSMGFKNMIMNLQRVDEQSRIQELAITAQMKQAFMFKSELVGRNTCGINFRPLNNMKLEIVHKIGSRIVYFTLSHLGKGPADQEPRFIDAEVSFLTCDNGKKESHAFKVKGRIQPNTNEFQAELCSLKDLVPFFHPKGLTINLSLKISEGKRQENVQPHFKEFVKSKQNSFGASLLENKEVSDFILECDGKRIPCHKIILAAGSPVFATMLQSGMQESVHNSMKIDDMTFPGLKMFLKLIYGGAASKNDRIGVPVAFDLLKAGEKYQIPEIRELATRILVDEPESKFPIEMIIQLFEFSKQMEITRLIHKAVQVFKKNGKEYVKSEEFSELLKDHTKFAQELISLSLEI